MPPKRKKKNEINLNYKLIDFSILKFEMNEPPVKITKKTKNNWLFGSKINAVEEKDELQIFIKAKNEILVNKEPFLLSSFEARSIFEIANISDFMINEDTVDFPKDFLKMCFGITYSTSRGAILTLMGTKVKNKDFMLPMINPEYLLPEEVEA